MPEVIDRRIAFNAGEISPWLDPRVDLDKYHLGARNLTNMEISPYGGIFRRPGTVYGAPVADQTKRVRLYPFILGDGTSYILEWNELKLRIWTTGDSAAPVEVSSTILEITTPYPADDLDNLSFAQLNDLLFIAHKDHPPHVLARYSATKWRLHPFVPAIPASLPKNDTDISLTVPLSAPTPAAWSDATTYAAGDVVTYGSYSYSSRLDNNLDNYPINSKNSTTYWKSLGLTASIGSTPDYSVGKRLTLTASAALFNSSMAGQKWLLSYDQAALTQTLGLNAASVNDVSTYLYVLGTWSAALTATTSGSGTWSTRVAVERSYDFTVWEIIAELQANNSDIQQLLTGSEDVPCFLRLRLLAKSGTIPAEFTGRLNSTAPKHTGQVRITSYLSTTTVRAIVEFPLPNAAGATLDWQADAWGGDNGYPACVSFHEGRLFWAGTETSPTTIWGSRVDKFGDYRLDSDPAAAVSYQLASDSTTRVRWLVSADELLVGTDNSEWAIGYKGSESIVRARRHSSIGSAAIQGLIVDDAVIYLQKSRRKVREFAWTAERSRYASSDLTLLAEHMGDSKLRSFALQRNPTTIVYIPNSNGGLRCLTYDRSQNIVGWTKYNTEGQFESVACVDSGGEQDEVWVVVRRTVNSATVRYVERFNTRGTRSLKDATQMEDWLLYMDCARPAAMVTGVITIGIEHLAGLNAQVVKDGVYLGEFPVNSSGELDIGDNTVSGTCTVGLKYTSIVEPTWLELGDPRSPSKAGKKRITRAILELYKSRGVEISGNSNRDFTAITDKLAPSTRSLFSGLIEEYVQADTERQATVRLRQTQPLPFNLLSLTLRYQLENS